MATGKVRIFELAKELNMSSKELIALFERLGIEAKNQLSVVEPKVADLLRAQLKSAAKPAAKPASAAARPAPATAAPAAPVAAAQPAPAAATAVAATPEAAVPPRAAAAPAATAAEVSEPVPQLKPVPAAPRRAPAAASAAAPPPAADAVAASAVTETAPVAAAPAAAASAVAPEASDEGTAEAAAPAPRPRPAGPAPRIAPGAPARPGSVAPRPAPGAPPRPIASPGPRPAPGAPLRPPVGPMPPRRQLPTDEAIPQLRPVPAGQASIVAPRPAPRPIPVNPNSASPGQVNGVPGRPGVAPRPGTGLPGQGYQPRPGQPGAPGVPGAPIQRRPAGNGPFRPLPGGPAPRPFTPRPPGSGPSPLTPGTGPSNPSSGGQGGRPGQRGGRNREDDQNKKDREQEMLLEKSRQRKGRMIDGVVQPLPAKLESIEIPDVLTVQELATSMIVSASDVIKELFRMGTMATINQNISSDQAIAVARKFGFNAIVKEAGDEVIVEVEEDRPELLTARPPVVTVLGHVDHGKTSLLDKIRFANVAAGEAGGITQKIGAYTVEKDDRKITFIDTPGHEAFTAMRARGAKVTDVAILVVAADDGVMPQTREAISHIKAAHVPIVVAINKMDKEDAQPDRVKQQLTDEGLQPVEWGGKIEMVAVSARTGDGIDALLETVLLEADLRELKANKQRRATGVVIESALDRGRGAVATVLVQNGTLRVGDVVVVGHAYGKIRALIDDKGKPVKKAGPSIPVEIMGLSDVPAAGDTLMVVSDERAAREAASKRTIKRRDVRMAATSGQRVSLETFMAMPADGGQKTLNLILKAEGQGSVEALRSRVESLSTAEVDIRVILAGVGGITPNDVNLASASNAVLIGFNIRPDESVKRQAESEQVDLRFYQVIYDVENDLKKAMVGMLAPKFREVILGRAEVREIFKVSKVGAIAGCYVQSGKLTRNAKVRVIRDSAVVWDGELESLRRFKDDVREVAENFECGVQVAKFADLKQGDVIEAWTSELVAPELQPA
jgi:translation initiation factor IF-2